LDQTGRPVFLLFSHGFADAGDPAGSEHAQSFYHYRMGLPMPAIPPDRNML